MQSRPRHGQRGWWILVQNKLAHAAERKAFFVVLDKAIDAVRGEGRYRVRSRSFQPVPTEVAHLTIFAPAEDDALEEDSEPSRSRHSPNDERRGGMRVGRRSAAMVITVRWRPRWAAVAS